MAAALDTHAGAVARGGPRPEPPVCAYLPECTEPAVAETWTAPVVEPLDDTRAEAMCQRHVETLSRLPYHRHGYVLVIRRIEP